MAKRDLPGIGLKGNYGIGEDGWGEDQNANLLKLSVLVQGGIIARVAAVPVDPAPTQGDVYVLTDAPNNKKVAAYDGGAWAYFTPLEGWKLYDRDANVFIVYDGAAWIEFEGGGGGGGDGIPDGGTEGQVLAKLSDLDGDADWVDPPAAVLQYYRIGGFFTLALANSEVVLLHTLSDDCTFADDFANSVGDVGTNPAATFTMDVQKNGASVGSIAISTTGAFTFATTGGALACVAGDQIKIVGPASAGTAANVSITLKATL